MNENLPPPNRAIGWYRFVLWLMPACVALTTAVVWAWLKAKMGWQPAGFIWPWWVFNILSTLGLGIFESLLRPPESREVFESTVTFIFLQLIIVPAIGVVVMLVLLAVSGI